MVRSFYFTLTLIVVFANTMASTYSWAIPFVGIRVAQVSNSLTLKHKDSVAYFGGSEKINNLASLKSSGIASSIMIGQDREFYRYFFEYQPPVTLIADKGSYSFTNYILNYQFLAAVSKRVFFGFGPFASWLTLTPKKKELYHTPNSLNKYNKIMNDLEISGVQLGINTSLIYKSFIFQNLSMEGTLRAGLYNPEKIKTRVFHNNSSPDGRIETVKDTHRISQWIEAGLVVTYLID